VFSYEAIIKGLKLANTCAVKDSTISVLKTLDEYGYTLRTAHREEHLEDLGFLKPVAFDAELKGLVHSLSKQKTTGMIDAFLTAADRAEYPVDHPDDLEPEAQKRQRLKK